MANYNPNYCSCMRENSRSGCFNSNSVYPSMMPPCFCPEPQRPRNPFPFLSSYIEATGSAQTVANNGNIVFSADEADLDIAGSDIQINTAGSIFTIRRPGLYHIEWSINLKSAAQPVMIGMLENGEPSSVISNVNSTGSMSSGALINVQNNNIPYTLSLHNLGSQIELADATGFAGTAASIRILRFADGASY